MNSSVDNIKNEKKRLLVNYLEENKSRYHTLFTCNQDAIFAMDLDGYLVQWNPAYEEISGYSEESKKMKFHSLIPVEDLEKVFHYFHNATLGQFHNYDCKMANKMGLTVDLNVTNIPIAVNDQIVGVYGVAKDITLLKRKKKELRKIEEIHRLMTENVLDIIISTDLQGKFHYVSPACQPILGYTPDEIMSQDVFLLFHSDDREKAYLDRLNVITKQENGRESYRFRKKDGSIVWVEILCKPIVDPNTKNIIEIVSVIRDITERKHAEEQARYRERTYRDLIEHSPDANLITRGNDILFINETGTNLFRASKKADIINKKVLDFIHPDFHEIAKERMNTLINGGKTEFFEYKLIDLDGTIFEAEAKGIPTIYQNKTASHIIIRDIGARKKTQELIQNSEKLTIAGQLAAGIAHEVRNPLTAIKGFLQLMNYEQPSNPAYFEIINSEMERIELILSELLVLAKPKEVKFETEDLITLFEEVKTLIDTQAIMNNVQITIIYDCDRLTIKCDKNLIKQVIINFLKNSIEAMPEGGFITIEIKKHSIDKIKMLVKDTGTGIPQHILKRIGEPFFTTKESGTGLGIMISKQIIENHNGSIHFWSDKKGTIIEVILPIS